MIAQPVRGADDRVLDHLQSDASGGHGRLSAGHEDAQRFDHAVAASRGDGSLACESSMSGVLGVEIVVLASPAAILFVRGRDLEHGNSGLLHKAQQASAIAAGRFHANALQVAKRPHPGQHLPIALAGRGETMSSQNAILFVHDRRDMQIFVRIHAADDATLYSFDDSHSQPPALTVHERLRRDRIRGQDSHETM